MSTATAARTTTRAVDKRATLAPAQRRLAEALRVEPHVAPDLRRQLDEVVSSWLALVPSTVRSEYGVTAPVGSSSSQ